jgi:hypothetical protein
VQYLNITIISVISCKSIKTNPKIKPPKNGGRKNFKLKKRKISLKNTPYSIYKTTGISQDENPSIIGGSTISKKI